MKIAPPPPILHGASILLENMGNMLNATDKYALHLSQPKTLTASWSPKYVLLNHSIGSSVFQLAAIIVFWRAFTLM